MPRTSAFLPPSELLFNRTSEGATEAAPSRRSFLRLSGFLTGGLVLPIVGTKALALVNPAQAESVAVAPVSMPVSRQLLEFRSLARGYARLKKKTWADFRRSFHRVLSEQQVVDRIIVPERKRVQDKAAEILARPVASWADVGEIAEVAWLAAPKDDCPIGPLSGQLARGLWRRSGPGDQDFVHEDVLHMSATAALIEAVLTMTGGQRFDMNAEGNADA